MNVAEAKTVARRWVEEHAAGVPGYAGAYHSGSVNWLDDGDELSATSDVDVAVVVDGAPARPSPGKLLYRGVLIDGGFRPRDTLADADAVLAEYQLAPPFSRRCVIADPSGFLAGLQSAVSASFARRRWVERRCAQAADKVRRYLASVDETAPLHDQAMSWLFAAGVTTHVLLSAGLQNPTVRRRYVAVRDVLARYGMLEFHETLLSLLGCADMSASRAAHNLRALEEVFDATKAVIRSRFVFAGDITDAARPIAIDGARELIDRGDHREAVFWIAVTASRCQKVLDTDAPAELREQSAGAYLELLADLRIATPAAIERRARDVEALLPAACDVAQRIIDANAEVHA